MKTEFGLPAQQLGKNAFVVDLTVESSMSHVDFSFPQTGFLRLRSIIAPHGPIPVSRSTWWAGVRSGRFPKGIKLGPKTTVWRVEDIRALIHRINASGGVWQAR